MQNKNISVSIILALVATFMVYAYMDSAKKSFQKENGQNVNVLVASQNIKELEIITPEMLEYKSVPSNFVQPFGEKNYRKLSKEALAGYVARIPIIKGEQITINKVSGLSARTGLSRQVTPGKRAFAIPINSETGVSKMIKPGDRVDVMAFIRVPKGQGISYKEVKTILQDVLILSLGSYVSNNIPKGIREDDVRGKVERNLATFTGYNTVTLEVFPHEAQRLAYILGDTNSSKALFLTLRNNTDKKRENLKSVTLDDVSRSPAASQPSTRGRR